MLPTRQFYASWKHKIENFKFFPGGTLARIVNLTKFGIFVFYALKKHKKSKKENRIIYMYMRTFVELVNGLRQVAHLLSIRVVHV